MTRLAPYLLVGVSIALCLSLIRTVPPVWCMVLGGMSGGLVFLFHALKWRTGKEGYQFAAITSMILPLLAAIALSRTSGVLLPFQYLGFYAVVYFLGAAIFRRQIRRWVQP